MTESAVSADLVTFTKEILSKKLHFLYSVISFKTRFICIYAFCNIFHMKIRDGLLNIELHSKQNIILMIFYVMLINLRFSIAFRRHEFLIQY